MDVDGTLRRLAGLAEGLVPTRNREALDEVLGVIEQRGLTRLFERHLSNMLRDSSLGPVCVVWACVTASTETLALAALVTLREAERDHLPPPSARHERDGAERSRSGLADPQGHKRHAPHAR